MIYRPFGKTKKNVSALGFGSIRFHSADLIDDEGLWRCAALVRKASSLGVNFFDVGPTYANGLAEHIYGLAFQDMPNPFFISDKSIITSDRTADDVRRRIENQLTVLGVKSITFFHMWSVMSKEHYLRVMAKGGPYEGAVKAKSEGLIEHICYSSHANATENLEIIQEGAFEGMILSFNALNHISTLPVIESANAHGMGVAAMNPLGGGIITKHPEHFKYLLYPEDESIASAALRFVISHPEISTAISGMGEEAEIVQNANALSEEQVSNRAKHISTQTSKCGTVFCTGCNYCNGCPSGIPIAKYMQAYNMRLFPNLEYMGRDLPLKNSEHTKAYSVLRALRQNGEIMPESAKNPCTMCGQCEERCTQHLPIMSSLNDISGLVSTFEYSKAHLCQRINDAFALSSSGRLGIYPSGVYSDALYYFLKSNFPDNQVLIFDKNPDLWGKPFADLTIMPPRAIPEHVDTLLISHFLYQSEIYKELSYLEDSGVHVVKLHKENDIPYFC